MLNEFEKLKNLIGSVEDDLNKAVKGQKAAATRVRKVMQEIKKAAQEVRVTALNHGPTAQDVAADVGRQVGGPGAEYTAADALLAQEGDD